LAETYAQRKQAVLRQVRLLRQRLTRVNTALEKTRREASRLAERSTLISADSLGTINRLIDGIYQEVNNTGGALAALNTVAGSYL